MLSGLGVEFMSGKQVEKLPEDCVMMGHGLDLLSFERFGAKVILSDKEGSSRPNFKFYGTVVTPGVPKVVGLRVRWQDVRDTIERSPKRRKQFEDACKSTFPKLDEMDVFTVVSEHLRCLSTVMTDVRRQAPPDELIAIHKRLSQQGESSRQGEPWSRYVVSPKGKPVHLKLAEDNVVLIGDMMSGTDRLPDLDLVQFGEGRPAPGR